MILALEPEMRVACTRWPAEIALFALEMENSAEIHGVFWKYDFQSWLHVGSEEREGRTLR